MIVSKVLPEPQGPSGGADLRFLSPQPDTSSTLQDHEYGASVLHDVPVYSPAFARSHCAYPQRDGQVELTWAAGYILRWFTVRRRSPIQVLTGPDVE